MKNGFTMIELIFVILILGLLSAVALPKLMATKDDANLVKEVANVKQVIQNANAEYLSQGSFSSYPSSDCFSFTTTTDGNFTVSYINANTSLCKAVASSKLSKDINSTYQMGGTKIKF